MIKLNSVCFYVSVSGGDRAGDPDLVTYAAVRSQKKKKKGSLYYVTSASLLTGIYFLA